MVLREEFLRRQDAEIADRFGNGDDHARRARELAGELEKSIGATRGRLRRFRLGARERAVPAARALPGMLFGGGGSGLAREAMIELLDALPHAFVILNRSGSVLFANLAWYEDLAGPGADMESSPRYFDSLPRGGEVVDSGPLDAAIGDVLSGACSTVRCELSLRRNGQSRHFIVEATALPSGGALVMHVDATALIDRRDEVERQATRDGLTELLNHQAFYAHARSALARGASEGSRQHVLMVDLDAFKAINDRLGHQVGDNVLIASARRLRACVRDGELTARLGGDEFAVLAREVGDAQELAARVKESLSAPLALDGQLIRPGASVGVATFPGDGADIDRLLQAADRRMYADKRARRAHGPSGHAATSSE